MKMSDLTLTELHEQEVLTNAEAAIANATPTQQTLNEFVTLQTAIPVGEIPLEVALNEYNKVIANLS
jgi:hypothetical protein